MKLIKIPVIETNRFKFKDLVEKTTNKGWTIWFYSVVIFRFPGEEDLIIAGKDLYDYLVGVFATIEIEQRKKIVKLKQEGINTMGKKKPVKKPIKK